MATEINIGSMRPGIAVRLRFTNGTEVAGIYHSRDANTVALETPGEVMVSRVIGQRRATIVTLCTWYNRVMIQAAYRDV